MKTSGLLAAMLLITLALNNAVAMPGKYSDVAAMLRQYELSSNKNLAVKEDMEGDNDEDGDEDNNAIIQELQDALLSSVIQGDGDDGLQLAAMMEVDEDDTAQLQFFRRAFRRFRNSSIGRRITRFRNSPIGRRITSNLRSRFCRNGK